MEWNTRDSWTLKPVNIMGLFDGFGLDDILGGNPAGIAADYGFRWKSVAMNSVKGLLGLDKRPNENKWQRFANALTPGAPNKKGYQGIDNQQYPIDGEIGEFITGFLDSIGDLKNMVTDFLTDPLGNLFGGSNWSYDHDVEGRILNRKYKGVIQAPPSRILHHVPESRYNQMLENKGYMEVEYPNDMDFLYIPFFENPKIEEKRKANYSSMKIFNRNEPIRLFTGAEARNLSLNFTYTLPHIMTFGLADVEGSQRTGTEVREIFLAALNKMKDETWSDNSDWLQKFSNEVASDFDAYKESIHNFEQDSTIAGQAHISYADYSAEFESANESIKIQTPYDSTWGPGYSGRTASQEFLSGKRSGGPINQDEVYQKVLQYIDYITNAIRTLVVGAVNSPNLGPPIIYLNFGTMYRNVPCICTNYGISVDQTDAGFDTDTLIPRQLTFSLELEEIRQDGKVGFGAYNPEEANFGLPGWEDFFKQGSMDPVHPNNSEQSQMIEERYR